MTMSFKCVDIGYECGYETMAESDEEMMGKVAEHAKQVHDLDPIPPEVVEKVKGAIREV